MLAVTGSFRALTSKAGRPRQTRDPAARTGGDNPASPPRGAARN